MSVSVKRLQVRLDEEGPLMFLSEWSMDSDVMGYHAYKDEFLSNPPYPAYLDPPPVY